MRKIIVTGSRSFSDRQLLFRRLSRLTAKLRRFELIHGNNPRGADALAEEWAGGQFPAKQVIRRHFPYRGELGRAGGPVRNQEMADYAGPEGVCVAFFAAGGDTPGTKDMVARARKKGMLVKVYRERE